MKIHITIWIPVLLALVLGACSGSPDADDSGASSASSSATTPMPTPGTQESNAAPAQAALRAASSDSQPSSMRVLKGNALHRIYLHDLMQRPAFAKAFHAMDGSDDLPGWVEQGGTATPAEPVTVHDETLLLAQACKPHDCPGERILLLYDKAKESMQGLFVHVPSPGMDGNPSGKARMTWLGDPDAATREWLQGKLAAR